MDMFRQDLQTVLFILSPLEVLRPFPVPSVPTTLRTTKAEQSLFTGSFLPCPRGPPLREDDRRGGGGEGSETF